MAMIENKYKHTHQAGEQLAPGDHVVNFESQNDSNDNLNKEEQNNKENQVVDTVKEREPNDNPVGQKSNRKCSSFWQSYVENIFKKPHAFAPDDMNNAQMLFTTSNIGNALYSATNCFTVMFLIGLLDYYLLHEPLERLNLMFLTFAAGLSALLVFDQPHSPLSQPRNLLAGNLISSFIGITIRLFLFDYPFLSSALSLGLAVLIMKITGTTHPPAGANAIIASAVRSGIPPGTCGYMFVLCPVLINALTVLVFGVLVNNCHNGHQYPKYWL